MKKPNIVFVLTDDQGYGDLACTGNPWIKTPNIDKLYGESVRFTNFHVGPTCAPTRSGLMTGHYANSTGVWHTVGGRSLLREDEITLPTMLKDGGYRTGIFGKWHLGDEYPYRPEDRGFEKVIVHGGGGVSQTPDYWGNDYFDDTYREDGEWKPFKGYCTDVFFREATKFIEADKDKPFFCYIATNAPHTPYNVEKKYADLYRGEVDEDRARFYGMITNIDENIGKLRKRLKELGIDRETIFIFMTDNGSSEDTTYDKDGNAVVGYNAGLRGMKNSEYDGGHRTPFFLHYPDMGITKGKDQNELVANVDFMPTLLDFCGVDYKSSQFHGKSIKSLCLDSDQKNDKFKNRFMVTDSQRLVQPVKWRKSAVMQGELRLVNGKELYNLTEDRLQLHDLSSQYPQKVKEFRNEYEKWWKLVSIKFEQPIPLHVRDGAVFTSHDWRGDENCVWNQGQIRQGKLDKGYFEIIVEESGEYEISLYRWPKTENYKLKQGLVGSDCSLDREKIQEKFWFYYENGKALPIVAAKILLDDEVIAKTQTISDEDINVTFKLNLKKGNHNLMCLFDLDNKKEIGAYYVSIKKCYNNLK